MHNQGKRLYIDFQQQSPRKFQNLKNKTQETEIQFDHYGIVQARFENTIQLNIKEHIDQLFRIYKKWNLINIKKKIALLKLFSKIQINKNMNQRNNNIQHQLFMEVQTNKYHHYRMTKYLLKIILIKLNQIQSQLKMILDLGEYIIYDGNNQLILFNRYRFIYSDKMSLEQLQCYEDDQYYDQSIKSTQKQSVQSIATLKSEQSIESLEKLVSHEQTKDSNLKFELDQFIGLLQKFKPSQLKNELSIIASTEQEEYYSFQQKQPQDKNQIMLEGYQKCFIDATKAINQIIINPKDHKYIIQNLEKMKMIYIMHIQSYQGMEKSINLLNSLKQTLIDADQEISLLYNQIQQQQLIIQKTQSQLKSVQGDLNQERLNCLDLQQKNQQLKHLILVANKQFEALQEKLLSTEEELNQVVSQQNDQIKLLVKTNKNLRETIIYHEIKSDIKQQSTSPLRSNKYTNNQENQYHQSNNKIISINQFRNYVQDQNQEILSPQNQNFTKREGNNFKKLL
ncbi:unnamed protein product [Paramecium pentaurelia]|uniref:Uncharacterized protein n=1 Tax=Paramecium pentaurelia TaxID=43138 RepID=A0A8S1UBJ3_9CILI|nr:unnamed protein product [Paramecium pentaurelia]